MNTKIDEQAAVPFQNTDQEIWRERAGDHYADSIHVTKEGSIGIDCGGTVYVMPVREWHQFAAVSRAQAEAGGGVPKQAYYETHEPPHCPTCGCGLPASEPDRVKVLEDALDSIHRIASQALAGDAS